MEASFIPTLSTDLHFVHFYWIINKTLAIRTALEFAIVHESGRVSGRVTSGSDAMDVAGLGDRAVVDGLATPNTVIQTVGECFVDTD